MMTHRSPSSRRVGRVALAWAALVAVGAAVGASLTPLAPAAAEVGDSSVTVKWAGGNDPAIQQHQVDHEELLSDGRGNDNGAGHWNDFDDLEVTVSKTANLRDEAVTVTVTGMDSTSFAEGRNTDPSNYLQLMQCWGPDPLAADFAETCQWGAWAGANGDTPALNRLAGTLSAASSVASRGPSAAESVPFRTAGGVSSVVETIDDRGNPLEIDGTARYYTAANSNEQPIAYVTEGESSRSTFTVQTAASQPYLGCGTATKSRCWLVVVPRGTHSGEWDDDGTLTCVGGGVGGQPRGGTLYQQVGSPIGPECSFFQNRVVVPLDFASPTDGCPPGAPETRLVGSELLADAMSSWQRGLCATAGTGYNLTTNSGTVTRDQLLTGTASVGVVANPLTPDTVSEQNVELLAGADLAYAPVANTALTVSFVSNEIRSVDGGTPFVSVMRDVRVTPRLLAKALTQSYSSDVPRLFGSQDPPALPTNAQYMAGGGAGDPEWTALGNPQPGIGGRGQFVVSGPQGEDVVALLWEYLQSDADASAFLRGSPDPWGQVINPYYLPSTHPAAQGGGLPFDLATDPVDVFLKADQTLAPSKERADLLTRGQRFDSVSMSPYSASLLANAERISRADTRRSDEWNPLKLVGSSGEPGGWEVTPPQAPSGRYVMGPTDAAAAARYALDSAALPLPLAQVTTKETVGSARTWVKPTGETMAAAAESLEATDPRGFSRVDPTRLSGDAYPLTAPLYAAVDLSNPSATADDRARTADFLEYVTSNGNQLGEAPGQLPAGYAPLTADQLAQTAQAATLLRSVAADGPTGDDDATGGPGTASAGGGAQAAGGGGSADAATTPGSATSQSTTNAAATTTSTAVAAQPAIGGALVAGAVGLLAAPFLLRRRTVGP